MNITIIEDDPLICLDIIGALKTVLPEANYKTVSELTELTSPPRGETGTDLVVLTGNHEGKLTASDEVQAWLRTCKVIAIDVAADEHGPDWHAVQRPFTQYDLEKAVRVAMSQFESVRLVQFIRIRAKYGSVFVMALPILVSLLVLVFNVYLVYYFDTSLLKFRR